MKHCHHNFSNSTPRSHTGEDIEDQITTRAKRDTAVIP